jgi:ferredoxin
MPIVKFVKENTEIEVPEGANLRREAIKAGINLNQGLNGIGSSINRFMNCKGMGMCGTCRVLITKGIENTNPMTVREKVKFKVPFVPTPIPDPVPCLAFVGHEDTMRLACMTRVTGDIEVESGPEVDLFGENFFS